MRRAFLAVGIGLLASAGAAHASTVLGLSVEDQARLSRLIVIGEVVAQQGVDDLEGGIETEVTLRTTHVLKGDVRPGESVVFHTRGGEADGAISYALGEAVFQTGQKVLVFVEQVEGRLYNLGLSMGVWNVLEGPGGRMQFTRALQDGLEVIGEAAVEHGPISLADMAARIARAERNPQFDQPMLRETFGGGR